MTVRVNLSGVPKKVRAICRNPVLGLEASSEAARLMDKFVPMRTGILATSADTTKPWQVSYSAPYARRLYYGDGFSFSKEKHPLARSHWDKGIDKAALARKLTEVAERL